MNLEVHQLHTAVLRLDASARVLELNAAAHVLLRTPQSHAQGLPLTQWFELDDAMGRLQAHIQGAQDEVARGVLRLFRQGDGSMPESPRLVYVTLGPRLEDGSHVLECLDLSDYEQQQSKQAVQAQAHSHQLLMRQWAHEIKNPLGGIRGATQLLHDELHEQHPEWMEYTEMVMSQVDRLAGMVDQYLLPYRAGMANAQRMNIHELCEAVLRWVKLEYPAPMVWRRDYDVSLPEVHGVADYLHQLLLNLAHNAAQAVQRAAAQHDADWVGQVDLRTRIARHVWINQRHHPLMLELSVIDNGAGVAEAIQNTLFLPMVSEREGGTGLGLSVALQIARQHGGSIECHSREGRTQMRVLLPIPTDRSDEKNPCLI